jgi:hypothetical protein
MVELTNAQIDQLQELICKRIEDKTLQSELLDHCCCSIESQMDKGKNFDEACQEALRLLHPAGLSEIEMDVQIALNQIIPLIMKKTLFFSGIIATFAISAGLLFKFMKWPEGQLLMLIGNLFLLFSMIGLLIQLIRFPAAFKGISFKRTLIGTFAGLLISNGLIFKIMHWPSANIQFSLGMGLLIVFFLPIFFWEIYSKEILNKQAVR